MQLRVHFPVNFQAKIKTLTLEKINLEILFFFFAFIEEKIRSKMVEGRRQGQAHRRASQKRINIHSTKL